MNKIAFLPLILMLQTAAIGTAAASEKAAWGYDGDNGPDKWGELQQGFALCGSGVNQSPINIDPKSNVTDAKLAKINFNYSMLIPERIHHNGHTVQVDMHTGGEIEIDKKTFQLKQFHFHTPSENTIAGEQFPMEIHFVHANEAGELAVIAMLLVPGAPNPLVAQLWEHLPQKAGDSATLRGMALRSIEMDKKIKNFYRFNGSLTTPPCTEGVRWIVLRTPNSVSKEQVEALQAVLGHPNNRPVQAMNARRVME